MAWNDLIEAEARSKQDNISQNVATINHRGFVTLLYGDTGTGKTFDALTFPEPIYVIDTENRALNSKIGIFKNKKIEIYEPIELKQEINKQMDDIFDEAKTINNMSEYLSEYVRKVKSGEIKGGTLVIDSATDVWSWIQSWMFEKLSKVNNKSGQARADAEMQTVLSQLDWKLANNKHDGIVKVLRSLIRYGIFIVYTARERSQPEYAVAMNPGNKEKIKCQKELPFACDVIFNLKKQNNKYVAICEKLGVQKSSIPPIEELTYDKIISLKPLG